MNEKELYHYGIKGMKWGVRRTPQQLGNFVSKKKSQYKSRVARNREYQTKKKEMARSVISKLKKTKKPKISVKNMSDAELRAVLNRMQMEQQYASLKSANISRGKAAVQKSFKVATTVATVTTTGLTIYNNAEKIKKILGK